MTQHFKQAVRLVREQKLYSTIYIAGTAVAVLMAMLVAFYLHLHRGRIYPEYHRDRALYMSELMMEQKTEESSSMSSGALSRAFVEQYLRPIEGLELVSLEYYTRPIQVQSTLAPRPTNVVARYVDAEYWRLYDYTFEAGDSFSEVDVASGRSVAVISRRLAKHLFGQNEALGSELTLGEQVYRVVGVVEDVAYVLPNSFGHLWIPYTTLDGLEEEEARAKPSDPSYLLGGYRATLLMRPGATPEEVRQDLARRLEDFTRATGWAVKLDGAPYSTLDRMLTGGGNTSRTLVILLVAVMLFLIIPALNLSGLNSSILEGRLSELGVCKAFGATNSSLLMQLIVENFLLSLIGSIIGFFLALFVASSLEMMYIYEGVHGVDMEELPRLAEGLTPSLLLDGWTMLYLIIGAFTINLISSLLPVWQFSRRSIVSSLSDNHDTNN